MLVSSGMLGAFDHHVVRLRVKTGHGRVGLRTDACELLADEAVTEHPRDRLSSITDETSYDGDDMTISAAPVRLDFDDYIHYTEMHPEGNFELIHGVIYKLAPEGDPHFLTRHGTHDFLMRTLDLTRYTPWNEGSFAAPNWTDGPKPDNFVSHGPLRIDGKYAPRPQADRVALGIEVSSSSRRKDIARATLYASLSITEYWMVDLVANIVAVFREPIASGEIDSKYRWFRSYGPNEKITSSAVDDLTVETNFLLELAHT